MIKKSLKVLTTFLAAGIIYASTADINTINIYADNSTQTSTNLTAPHFDTEGFAVVKDIKYHKTGDRTVEVYKGVDSKEDKIVIPSKICVDGVTYDVISIGSSAFYNIPETRTIVDEDGNVVNKTDDMVPFKATKIVLPESIKAIGNDCFYGLINVRCLDLSNVESIGATSLRMDSNAILDRVKLGNDFDPYYTVSATIAVPSGNWTSGNFRTLKFNNYDFNRIQFRKMDNSIASKWLVKSNVRINELQDPEVKEGYNFSGWKQNSFSTSKYEKLNSEYTSTAGTVYAYNTFYTFTETYTYYTPSYELGQTLNDMEDRLRAKMSNMVVTVNTTESDILKMVASCKTASNIAFTVENFRVVAPEPENDVKGAVRCTINLTNKNNDEKKSVDFNIQITEAPIFPSQSELKGYIDKYREYTVSTTSDNLVDYIKGFVDDKRFDIRINNFTNDGYHVQGNLIITNTIDNTYKNFYICKVVYSNIDAVVNYAINNLNVDPSSTKEYIIKQINNVISDDRYTVNIADFRNNNGFVAGTVYVSDKYGILCINELNAKSTFSVIVDSDSVNSVLNNMPVSVSTTASNVISELQRVVDTSLFTITVDNFSNYNGFVSGTVVITKVDGTVTKFPFERKYDITSYPSKLIPTGGNGTSADTTTPSNSGNTQSGNTSNGTISSVPAGTGNGGISVGNTSVSSPVNVVVMGGSGTNNSAANTNVSYQDLLNLLIQLSKNNGQTTVVNV